MSIPSIDSEGIIRRDFMYYLHDMELFTDVSNCISIEGKAGFIINANKRGMSKVGKLSFD